MLLGCGLWWAHGSMCYMEVHIGASWRIRLNRPCSAALQKRLNRSQCPLGVHSCGPKEPCIRWESRWPYAKGQLLGKGHGHTCQMSHILPWAVQKWLTDQDAIWVVDSDRPNEACISWHAHWRHLANTTEPSTVWWRCGLFVKLQWLLGTICTSLFL